MDSQTKVAKGRERKTKGRAQGVWALWTILALLVLELAGSGALGEASSGAAGPLESGAALPQGESAQFADAARLVVMIDSTLDGNASQGAGILFAIRGSTAYVLTANHVVRSTAAATSIQVYFSVSPDTAVPATLLPQFSQDLDLAVLQVDAGTIDLQQEKLLPFELLLEGDSSKLKRGDPVFPIGNPDGYKWASPLLAPDRFDHADQQRFYFQSHNVKVGYSGGAVCSADWHVAGIVLAVAEAPVVQALPVEVVLQQIKGWGLGIGASTTDLPASTAAVLPAATPALAEDASKPAGGGLKEGVTEKGASYQTSSPWGGFSDTDPTWVQIAVQKIENMPPMRTTFGNTPTFALVISERSGATFTVKLGAANHVTFPPGREQDLDGAMVRVVTEGWFSNSDATFPAQITFPKVRMMQKLLLRYVDGVMGQVHDLTDNTEVTMLLQARQFLPDAKSGPEKDPATAEVILPGVLNEGKLSFNEGHSTDHMILNSAGGSCKGLLWIEATGQVGLTSTARRVNEGSVSLVLDSPGEGKMRLYELRCDGKRTMIRVQAEEPGSEAKFHFYVASDAKEGVPQLTGPLVQGWIDSWVAVKKDSFEFKEVTGSEWGAIDQGLEIIRQHTSGTTEDLVNSLNAALDRGTDETFSHLGDGYWNFLESIVSRHRDEFTTALGNCCRKADKIRFMTNLLRAEGKLPFDQRALAWAKGPQAHLPDVLQARVAQVMPQTPTP